jgi:hypothetical protein
MAPGTLALRPVAVRAVATGALALRASRVRVRMGGFAVGPGFLGPAFRPATALAPAIIPPTEAAGGMLVRADLAATGMV